MAKVPINEEYGDWRQFIQRFLHQVEPTVQKLQFESLGELLTILFFHQVAETAHPPVQFVSFHVLKSVGYVLDALVFGHADHAALKKPSLITFDGEQDCAGVDQDAREGVPAYLVVDQNQRDRQLKWDL